MALTRAFSFVTMMIYSQCVRLGSASEPAGCMRASVLPSSGPTVCLPLDQYLQLQPDDSESNTDAEVTPAPRRELDASASTEKVYRYMSPMWLRENANFSETPTSVSEQAIEFGSGPSHYNWMFKVDLVNAGVLDDEKRYSIHIALYFATAATPDSDPIFVICDNAGSYCAGFQYDDSGSHTYYYAGENLDTDCQTGESGSLANPTPGAVEWNIRLELHPTYTVGLTYAATTSILTYKYLETLKPSRGLHFRVCREHAGERFKFHLFELTLKVIE